MKSRFSFMTVMGLACALAFVGTARAQSPANPAPNGQVDNTTSATSTTTTTTISAPAMEGTPEATDAETTPANTGGAPWLMAMAGLLTTGGALFLRRKLA